MKLNSDSWQKFNGKTLILAEQKKFKHWIFQNQDNLGINKREKKNNEEKNSIQKSKISKMISKLASKIDIKILF
jgi:hypothetical protein